ncbi:MAG TPA: CBS domain-containing protein [Chitinophagales bacterium]|nr:CBS domain-containing protein [Chitinophagales bacterium]
MNKVSSILSRKKVAFIGLQESATVLDALKLMLEKNIGSVIVMSGDTYLGIVTERDYSRKVVLAGKHSDQTTVAEIMSEFPKISPDDTIERCMELMSDKNIRYLPVFENEKLVGLISISDVVAETIRQQKTTISHLEDYIKGS